MLAGREIFGETMLALPGQQLVSTSREIAPLVVSSR
jgi:hypothetical protein